MIKPDIIRSVKEGCQVYSKDDEQGWIQKTWMKRSNSAAFLSSSDALKCFNWKTCYNYICVISSKSTHGELPKLHAKFGVQDEHVGVVYLMVVDVHNM